MPTWILFLNLVDPIIYHCMIRQVCRLRAQTSSDTQSYQRKKYCPQRSKKSYIVVHKDDTVYTYIQKSYIVVRKDDTVYTYIKIEDKVLPLVTVLTGHLPT